MMSRQVIEEMMREWKRIQDIADYLKSEITREVLDSKITIDLGDVSVRYNPERHYHDYAGAVHAKRSAMKYLVDNYLTVDWLDPSVYRRVCTELDLEAPVDHVTGATVTLKSDNS